MSGKEFRMPADQGTLSVRLPIGTLGRLYTAAANDLPDVSTIVYEALERWLDERDQIKLKAREDARSKTPKRSMQ